MRKLIYTINLSVDGCLDHTKLNPPDADLSEFFIQLVRDAGLLVYGRKTYQLMVPYWPDIAKNPEGETKEAREFAQAFDACNIIVFSRTLEKAEGNKTKIIRDNLKEEILALKQQPGKDILVGGVDIPSQLIELGLIDEYYFAIMPLVAGEGKRLMGGIGLLEKIPLKLVEARPFASGSVLLHYQKLQPF